VQISSEILLWQVVQLAMIKFILVERSDYTPSVSTEWTNPSSFVYVWAGSARQAVTEPATAKHKQNDFGQRTLGHMN